MGYENLKEGFLNNEDAVFQYQGSIMFFVDVETARKMLLKSLGVKGKISPWTLRIPSYLIN
jgi:hypothetical protein